MKTTHTQSGSTTLGIIVGIVLGLAVALGVSLYLANAGAPVQTKAANVPARIEPPKDLSKAPDPNEALYTKVPKSEESKSDDAKDSKDAKDTKDKDAKDKATTPAAAAPSAAAAQAATKPEQDGIGKVAALVTPAPAATAASKPGETIAMPKPAPLSAGGERYFVQAGAFSNVAEAETLKAKLALQGVSMSLSPREKDGQTLQRVRTAPLAAVDAEKLRNTLKANGIETSLVKVQ
jgi:cell division protein FtsN